MSTISDNYVSEPSCDPRVTEQESGETGLRQKCDAATIQPAQQRTAVALSLKHVCGTFLLPLHLEFASENIQFRGSFVSQ